MKTATKVRNKYFFVLFYIATSFNLYAGNITTGNGTPDVLTFMNSRIDLLPHSPEVESLGKYGLIPVNLYSGLPDISIPIYTIKTQSLNIPISLQYNYNGCKPNEMSTCIGLGWILRGASGTITRLIKGQFDENMGSSSSFDSYCDLSILSSNHIILSSIGNKSFDGQPDQYIFNVANYSGRFIIFRDKVYIDKYPNIQIVPDVVNGKIISFTLIDENGNNYLFNDKEVSHGKYITPYTSDWQLSRIISSNKQDTITYDYLPYRYRQSAFITDSYSITNSECKPTTVSPGTLSVGTFDGNYVEALLLSSITYKNGTVEFNLTNDREDLPQSTGAKMLDKITITSAFTDSKRTILFNQDYFSKKNRLKLSSIYFEDEKKSYYFSYNDGNFPAADTRGIDLFGYYNGKTTNRNLFPDGFFSTSSILSYANRNCDTIYSSIGCLKSIIYPSGGYSTFDWEQNKAGHLPDPVPKVHKVVLSPLYNPSSAIGNTCFGIKYFSIEKNQTVKVTTSRYMASANRTEIPLVQILKGSQIIYTSPILAYQEDQIIDSLYLEKGRYTLKVMINNTMSGVQGEVDYYTMITDMKNITDGPGLRIKKISDYTDASSQTPSRVDSYTYNDGKLQLGSSIKTIGSEQRGNSGSNYTTSYYASIKSALSDYDSQLFYYGKVTKYTHKSDGDLKSDYIYCNNPYINDVKLSRSTDYCLKANEYSILCTKKYKYDHILLNTWYPFSAYKSVTLGGDCSATNVSWDVSLSSPDVANPGCVSQIFSVYDQGYVSSSYTLVKQDSITTYDQSGQNGVSVIVDYEYDNPNHYLPTKITTTNSTGEKTIVINKYPYDYNFSEANTPNEINTLYKNEATLAANNYNKARADLISQIQQYGIYCYTTAENKKIIDNIVNKTDLLNDYSIASNKAINNRNSRFSEMSQLLEEKIKSTPVSWQKAVLWMQLNNIKGTIIEKTALIDKGNGTNYVVGSVRNDYKLTGSAVVLDKQEQAEINGSLLYNSFDLDRDNYYKVKKTYLYNNNLRVRTEIGSDNLPVNYIWGYGQLYPVAIIAGGDYSTIDRTINLTKVNNMNVENTESLNTELDKLRIVFADKPVIVQTYAFNPLFDAMISYKSPRNISTYYTYDNLGRLNKILDTDKKIVKEYAHHYSHMYSNSVKSKVFTKNDCTECSTGSASTYIVSANKYTSYISQNDADSKALEDIDMNGQAYANTQGTCTPTCISSDTRRCINGICEIGVKVYINSYPTPNGYVGQYTCIYVYEFSDGSTSIQFSQIVKGKPCVDSSILP